MAALVQTFPAQQSATPVGLMQSRSQSSGSIHSSGQVQAHPNTSTRYRDVVAGHTGYRPPPVAPYAFTSTPNLSTSRSASTTAVPQKSSDSTAPGRSEDSRPGYTSLEAISNDPTVRPPLSSNDTGNRQPTSRPNPRPLSVATLQPATPPGITSPTRAAPERYKKVSRRPESMVLQTAHLGGSETNVGIYNSPGRAYSSPTLSPGSDASPIADYTGQLRSQSVDDMHTYVPPAARYVAQNRRRSVGTGSITAETFQSFLRQELASNQQKQGPSGVVTGGDFKPPHRPGSRRTGSTDSSGSGTSSRASSTRGNSISSSTSGAPSNASAAGATHEINPSHVPPRGSSTDAHKRATGPSPLSKPVTLGAESGNIQKPTPSADGDKSNTTPETSAALNDVQRKGMKNRLRRAFSFGSAAELRKASAANLRGNTVHRRPHQHQDVQQTEEDAETARVARKQEASGLGENIYNGQGNFFTGSTDNLSVSSTASSASIMIRKMGKGLKRSSRSFVGIFRPKSAIGVPAADSSAVSQATQGPISMVTVEAEREKVNVNAHPSDKQGGVTDFPKLERNSIDASQRPELSGSSDGEVKGRQQSITSGERERAEILASMKKGILKRSGSASPIIRAADRGMSFQIPDPDSARPDSMKEGEDYFKPGQGANSAPGSPNSAKYSVKFSPRITFFDTWTAGEYDRRGEVATCNRLTPMLAQQIKEELNTFKMEMDVHEESKVYTHFF